MKLSKLTLPLVLAVSVFAVDAVERRVTALERLTKAHTSLFGEVTTVLTALQATDMAALKSQEVGHAVDAKLLAEIEKLRERLTKLEPKPKVEEEKKERDD